jgi:hypothetical protein
MTSELASFAARLRERISPLSRGTSLPPVQHDRPLSDEQFSALALELFALQFTHNAAYRRLCEARGVLPATVEHWWRIPAVPAAAFKELELTCLAPEERLSVFHSSGTTGLEPSRHFHGTGSLQLYEASLWPWFEQHVLAGLDALHWALLVLTPPPAAAAHSSLAHMFETVRQRSGAGKASFVGALGNDGRWIVDLARAEAALHRAVEAGEPLVLLGTAFNFVHLLDALASQGLPLQLPAGSRVMETGGYKGRSRELPKAELHALIEERLGVARPHIICEYGMSELSSQAYDGVAGATLNPQPSTRVFHFPPWCRVQIISPETGQEAQEGATGLLRIFDLANVYSVMTVQTEDLAVRREDGFELTGRAPASEPRGCSLMATEGA